MEMEEEIGRTRLYNVLDKLERRQVAIEHDVLMVREALEELHHLSRLRREIQLFHRNIDTPVKFSRFAKLPPEIRQMIWNFAIPRRVVSIMSPYTSPPPVTTWYHFQTTYPPPAISQVCQESRKVALRHGRLRAIENEKPDSDAELIAPGKRNYHREWAWFDSSRDTLFLDLVDVRLPETAGILHLTQATESLMIRHIDGESMFNRQLHDPHHFPRLKTISFLAHQINISQSRNITDEIEIFGADNVSPFMVDLDDHEDMRRMAAKLHIPANDALNIETWIRSGAVGEFDTEYPIQDTSKCHDWDMSEEYDEDMSEESGENIFEESGEKVYLCSHTLRRACLVIFGCELSASLTQNSQRN
ncbi:hypothetical protein SCUP515_11675 [Seiridium cupressi]